MTNCGKEVYSVIAGILLILSIVVGIQPIFAFNVDVIVIIERIKELEGFGFLDAPDFYAVVTIDGIEKDNKGSKEQQDFSGNSDIRPDWRFKQSVDYFKGTIPVKIQVYEADSFLRFGDDYADLHPETGKRALVLNVNLDPCSVSGHVTGNCNTRLISSGNSDDRAMIYFKIEVTPPPAQGNLRVYCIHDPIFPSPGEDVTVTVNSLRKASSPGLTIQNPADTIEIWVNSRNAPYATGSGTTLSKSIGSFAQGDFSYGCFVSDGGVPMFSGWRTVSVGDPGSRAIPILYNGYRAGSIDVVFIPDKNTPAYSSYSSSTFIEDVAKGIQAWLKYDVMKQNIDLVNFWIAKDKGEVKDGGLGGVPQPDGCGSDAPDNWDDDYTFADAGVLVHRDKPIDFRDCAPGGDRFHTWLADVGERSNKIIRHEAGHRPFGLADEYDKDGGYFQSDDHPNLYKNIENCENDIPSSVSRDCRKFIEEIRWWFDADWFTSDPENDDLMASMARPRALDLEKINWMFGECDSARC